MTTTRLTLEDIPPILCPDLEKLVFEYVEVLPYLDELSKYSIRCRFCNNIVSMLIPRRYNTEIPIKEKCDKNCKGSTYVFYIISRDKYIINNRLKIWDDNENTYLYESQLLK